MSLLTASQARKLSGLWRGRRFIARARRTKAPNSTCRFIKGCDFADVGLHDRRENQLSDPRPALDHERLSAEIGENDVNLTAIIGVEGAWGIKHRNAVVKRESGARPDLTLDPSGERKCKAGWNRRAPPPVR